MTNQSAFFEAWVHADHNVLGKQLQPLCLIHLVWLYNVNSPLVYTSLPITLPDLEIAVTICSSTTNEEIMNRIEVGNGSPWWKLNYHLWHARNKKRDLEQETMKFLAYQSDYLSLPNLRPTDGECDEVLPWLFTVAASVIMQTGWDEEKVFTMPLGKLLWLNLGFQYLASGRSNIISDREHAAIELILAEAKRERETE